MNIKKVDDWNIVGMEDRDLKMFWESFHNSNDILYKWLKKNNLIIRGNKVMFLIERKTGK